MQELARTARYVGKIFGLWIVLGLTVVGSSAAASAFASPPSALGGPAAPHVSVAAPVPAAAPVPLQAFPTSPSGLVGSSAPGLHLGNFQLPGPHPASWGSKGIPPGWEALAPASRTWSGGSGTGGSTASTWHNRFCAGLWPSFENAWGLSSQGAYASGCYGHDEPGIQFESNLAGSGGNVTWNVTLPTDRNATENQSNLYSAIWFGMTMTDPYAWMDQCFLELQFYPDQTFYNPGPLYPNWTVNGAWIGAAVAWQIEASTGAENPCFYTPLYLNGVPGPAFLNMTQGDRINVAMRGYPGSSVGEQLVITDRTNGQVSNVTMYNYAQGYPIDPSYQQSAYEASLQWTPGGEYPVSFAFETGHAGNPDWPANNSYGGCSGGTHSTPTDPGAPCPSYDPGSWANDTRTPWKIDAPTFSNAHATDHPAQVAFTQPEGGLALVDATANGACTGSEGSAWCSYPFYSYYCNAHTFEFGGVDYPNVTSDFGKYTQFNEHTQTLSFGGSFFPPTNFSIPVCSGSGASVSVGPGSGGGGSVYFLSHDYGSTSSLPGLGDGTYSIHAIPSAGMGFSHWTTTGSVSVALPTSPYTTLQVHGGGSAVAVFTSSPSLTAITFRDSGRGIVGLDPNFLWTGSGAALATLANGASYSLGPGIYSIQAYPRPGWNFTYWTTSGGVSVAVSAWPYTQLIVNGLTTTARVTAWYAPTTANGTIDLYSVGFGKASFGSVVARSTSPNTYAFNTGTMLAGTYPIVVTPGPGVVSWSILYGPPLIVSNNSRSTFGNLEAGTAILEVIFVSGTTVTVRAAPAAGGSVYALSPAGGYSSVPSGTNLTIDLGSYGFAAAPAPGFTFTGWSTPNPGHIAFASLGVEGTVTVTGTGTITANFVRTSARSTVLLLTGPTATSGRIAFNLAANRPNGTTLSGVAPSQYVVTATPAAGYGFASWTATGKVSLAGSAFSATTVVLFAHGSGTLRANFARITFAVSFVLFSPHHGLPGGSLTVNGVRLHSGETANLPMGTYRLVLRTSLTLGTFEAIGGLSVSLSGTTWTVHVAASGTVEAVLT